MALHSEGDGQSDGQSDGDGQVKDKGQGDWLHVYLLLEFQSSNDPFMAVRILT